jgi:hypothetical protein
MNLNSGYRQKEMIEALSPEFGDKLSLALQRTHDRDWETRLSLSPNNFI